MLIIAILLFLIAAVFGMVVLISILQDKPTPKVYVFIHGAFALAALLIVTYYVVDHIGDAPATSLILFIIAAFGGLALLSLDMKGKKLPKSHAILHPLLALIALFSLIVFVLQRL